MEKRKRQAVNYSEMANGEDAEDEEEKPTRPKAPRVVPPKPSPQL
jgi:hypothetical protein